MIIRCRLTLPVFKLFFIICKTTVKLPCNGLVTMAWKQTRKKFQFMILSPNQHEVTHLKLCDDVSINSESSVKVLGVIIDNRLTFTEHISRCCKKAARQLNALSRIAKYLDMKSKKLIFNSFIMSNFNYCPLVWHFCGKGNNDKLEQIQERSLRTLLSYTRSDYESLLDTFGTIPLLTSRLKYMTLEAVRSVRQENAACLHDMFHVNEVPYEMRWNKIIQPKMKTTTHGLRSFSYLGAKLLNDLLKEIPDVCDLQTEFTEYEMKNLIKCWEGPMIDNTYAYVWSRPGGTVRHWFWSCFNLMWIIYLRMWFLYSLVMTDIGHLQQVNICCFTVSHASFTCLMIIYSLYVVYMSVYSTVHICTFTCRILAICG